MKSRPIDNYNNVNEYIAYQDESLQPSLKKIRAIIQSAVPHAEECISYMIPCYKYKGMLVGFGTYKKGCSFYTMNPVILRSYTAELKDFQYTGSTIHFDPKKTIPVALLKKLIKYRISENEEKDMLKKHVKNTQPKKEKK